jgi:1,4-dihydroxy-2-naphthoate octaprenyltransferase
VKPKTRFTWALLLVVGSIMYGCIVAYDEELARTLMLGYIGLLLTIFVCVEVWKRRDE